MELVYLWVKDYKNIQKQGFNFSPRFECKYENEKLTIIPTPEKAIENFFDNKGKINVTAIVGKNGSGKSSITESIELGIKSFLENDDLMFNTDHPNFKKYILIFRMNQQYYNIGNINLKNKNISNRDKSQNKIKNMLQKHLHFYNYREENQLVETILNTFHQLDSKLITFFYPDKIVLNFTDYLYNNIAIDKFNLKEKLHYVVENEYSLIQNKLKERFGSCSMTMEECIEELKKSDLQYGFHTFNNEILILEKLLTIKNYIGKNKLSNISSDDKTFYQVLFETEIPENFKEFLLALNQFNILEIYDSSQKEISPENYKNFGINFKSLSSGEKSFLNILLSLAFAVRNNQKNELTNLLILLDEPENKLHPQLQKSFLLELINIFQNSKLNIHLLLSSHSPFLLSDIPKQNIIFLAKDKDGKCKVADGLKEKKQTFGANIHTLLSDGFFMEDGLMGEFAKGKINQIKTFYERIVIENKTKDNEDFYQKNKKEFEQIQEIIGEPFLKTIIGNYLIEIEKVLVENKAEENEINRFLKKFGKDKIKNILEDK